MAENWYPIIDYEKCKGCLSYVEFCPHGVLVEEDGKPKVVHPEECVEFCRGCQKGACEFDAIKFPPDLELTDRDKIPTGIERELKRKKWDFLRRIQEKTKSC